MSKWLRRIRAALVMGLMWAVAWWPVGPLLGVIFDPDGRMDEPWIAVGALPGFLAGVLFSIVLGIAAGRRKLRDLSLAKVAAWGAIAGALLGSITFGEGDQRMLPLIVTGSLTVLSAASAAASLALARKSETRELSGATEDVAELR